MNTSVKTALAATALLVAGSVAAQGYVGGAIGQGRINVDCDGIERCDKTGTGWKLFGGYRFHPNLAVEANYFDFGKARGRDEDISASVKGTGMGIGLAGIAEFSPSWYGVARVGIARTKAKLSGTDGGLSLSVSDTSTNPYYGLALGWAMSPNLAIEAGFDVSKIKYDDGEVKDSASTRLFSIGLNYRF